MSESFISSLHIQKLGHKLEEIRIRALNHIISKLETGVTDHSDFPKYVELLKKLFQWFYFERFQEEHKVIQLISKLLSSEIGKPLLKHIGAAAIVKDLKAIRERVRKVYHKYIDDTIKKIQLTPTQSVQNIVPPLVSDLPLSYRSNQTEYETELQTIHPIYSNSFGTTATTINIFEQKSPSGYENETGFGTSANLDEQKSPVLSGIEACNKSQVNSFSSQLFDAYYKSIPYVTLNWQPLVKSDCHVLKSVEESLQKPPQPSVLIHSCDFFCNVMLQDFPAEVFLQRPAILTLFYDIINNSPSTRITNAALICLNKLSENLITRIRYYSDPCTYNLKHGTTSACECCENEEHNVSKKFSYHIDGTVSITSESTSAKSDSFLRNQISLPQYCLQTFCHVLTYLQEKPQSFRENKCVKKTQSGINTALQIVDKLVTLTTLCIKSSIWSDPVDGCLSDMQRELRVLLEKLGDVLEQYRLMVAATDMEYFERMAQLHLLHSVAYLLFELVPISKSDIILPRSLKCALSTSLLDTSFGKLYPAAHETLIQYVNTFSGQHEMEYFTKYKDIQVVCTSMTQAVKLLKYEKPVEFFNSLRLIFESLPSLEFHRNLTIINIFLKLCIKNCKFINENSQKLIEDTLLQLLSHTDDLIRKETYFLCQKLITNILGLNHVQHMSESDPGSQVVFFFRTSIFVEIAAHGLGSDSIPIQTSAEDILVHILKCKFLVSESIWKKIVKALMPSMPILQCWIDSNTPLGKALVKILDPDISPALYINSLDVLKGNMRMLFSNDVNIRNEAVSRLSWLMSKEKDASFKIPRITSLHDCGFTNVFQVDFPFDLSRKRSNHQFYQPSAVQQVIELLNSKTIEPSIRRSALNQLSVMMEDHFTHNSFLEFNGLKTVLNILQMSLTEKEFHNYPDSVMSAISILKNICLHNAVVRQELALDEEVLFNILRGLFLYCTDKKIQQDGMLLCSLVLFSEYAIYSSLGTDSIGLSLPDIVIRKLNIPFKCHTHWKTSRHTRASLLGLLASDDWCKGTLRMHWNIEWYGGVNELITLDQVPNITTLTTEQLAEFSADLRLTQDDLLALKASSIVNCCQKYLYDIENSASHQSVCEAVKGLVGYVNLWLLVNKSGMYNSDDSLIKLPWDSSFCRFLSAPPANNEDQNLLIEILRYLDMMVKLFKNSEKTCWIADVLQDSTHYLSNFLKIDVKSDQRSISLELLQLIADCSTLEQHLLDIGVISKTKKHWVHIVKIITENLKFSDTEQFYNLAYLDKLLHCLVQITSNIGWSEPHSTSPDFHKIFSELIAALSELLTAFHHGKGVEAASSFMGLSITRNSLLTMNHILHEMQYTLKKNWESFWLTDTVCNGTLFSLISLWTCRDVVVRAATLQLLAGLAASPRGATVIVENIRQKHGGVWEITIRILLDHSESSVVREHAAILLTNLCSHVNLSGCGQATLPLCHAPITTKKSTSPMDTLLLLLKERNFYDEVSVLLSCIHLDSTFDPSILSLKNRDSPRISYEQMTARSYILTSSESASSNAAENGFVVFVTPSLVKNVANFMSNLLYLSPERVADILAQYGLIRSFLRCLSSPSADLTDSRQYLLYVDTLEMCSAICALLTRSVLVNVNCRMMIIHTRDCLQVLMSLLNPDLYDTNLPQFLYLRNNLWCEIFRFLTALLDTSSDKHAKEPEYARECYKMVSSLLAECGYESFIKTICESIETKTATGLQRSALQSLTSLLNYETSSPIKKMHKDNNQLCFQTILDTSRSPRLTNRENEENTDPNKDSATTNKYKIRNNDKLSPYITNKYLTEKLEKFEKMFEPLLKQGEANNNVMVGADLCSILLRLYEMNNIENVVKKKGVVVGALSSLLKGSDEAKKCALNEGLLENVFQQLKTLHIELSMHSAESLNRITDKKKICPILKEVESHFALITNFMIGNASAKMTAASMGLADFTHKFWIWFSFERSMLVNVLKMLITFTTDCEQASQSMILTSSVPGSGPRKVPNNMSLLHAIIHLIAKEMELVSRSHDITVLQLSFHVLQNICASLECRTVIAKSNLLQCMNRLHPAITKRQRPWDSVELLCLEFLEMYTFYPEGQIQLTKHSDLFELIISLTNSPKMSNKMTALSVMRNIAFHHSNKIKLLTSVEFIQVLHNKLVNGTFDEKNIVVSMIWALSANSQRSKMVMKCAGIDVRIQELIKQSEMQGIAKEDKSYLNMLYVANMLKEGER